MGKTKIEYSDEVSNPLQVVDTVTGKKGTHCEKPDPTGTCRWCWAEVLNTRGGPENQRFGTGLTYDKKNRDRIEWVAHSKEMVRLSNLNQRRPMSKKFPGNKLVVFTNDTYDLFQPSISDELRNWVFNCYDDYTNLNILVQTTYAAAMKRYLMNRYPDGMPEQYIIGMSAGTQSFFDNNIGHLRSVPAKRRYVIFEPLLELVMPLKRQFMAHPVSGDGAIHWLIIGGESGPQARPCDVGWIRSLAEKGKQCGAAILVKQLGSNSQVFTANGRVLNQVILKDRKGGNPDEWPDDLRIREFCK